MCASTRCQTRPLKSRAELLGLHVGGTAELDAWLSRAAVMRSAQTMGSSSVAHCNGSAAASRAVPLNTRFASFRPSTEMPKGMRADYATVLPSAVADLPRLLDAVKVPTDLSPEFKARANACYQAPSRAIERELRAL